MMQHPRTAESRSDRISKNRTELKIGACFHAWRMVRVFMGVPRGADDRGVLSLTRVSLVYRAGLCGRCLARPTLNDFAHLPLFHVNGSEAYIAPYIYSFKNSDLKTKPSCIDGRYRQHSKCGDGKAKRASILGSGSRQPPSLGSLFKKSINDDAGRSNDRPFFSVRRNDLRQATFGSKAYPAARTVRIKSISFGPFT